MLYLLRQFSVHHIVVIYLVLNMLIGVLESTVDSGIDSEEVLY